ncbi:alpha/beta hydrolase [Streptomyces roseirectus]|uniref:Alpha/beta hydrolase n=1 Tax=Streptomyces roseirectus TaxID=2768066 RepID=A0A7H0IG14_9ACTN|nr:alpha/beta hydrolase [Streptomyces roseirectus]QNP71730.1 alpha/beta hydrolase [Streptomyces roseirectus]
MRQLDDDLGHLAYDVTGDGPPLVLVHAGVADHRMWDGVTAALAERYTVVRYDLRGFGESEPPRGPFREADDLRRLLDHLGHGRVRLAGASWGARVALDFTLAHPSRVHALAMLAAPWPGFAWSEEMVAYDEAETTALDEGDVDGAVELNLDMWLRGPARTWDEVEAGLADQLRAPMRTLLAHQGIVGRYSQGPGEGDLAGLDVRTLVGVGKLDIADFQEIARRYAQRIPGAEFVEFPTAAHLIAMDAPAEVAGVLGEFFAG